MSTQEVIENKISFIRQQLDLVKKFQGMTEDEFKTNTTSRAAVERYLYVIVQAAIDLSEATIAYKKLRKPTTMRESIEILGEAGIVPSEFCQRFVKMVGFRNTLAHDYGIVDARIVYGVLQEKLKEVEEFLGYIEGLKLWAVLAAVAGCIDFK